MIQFYLLSVSSALNIVLLIFVYLSKRKIKLLERNNIIDQNAEFGEKVSGSDLFLNLTQAKSLAKSLKVKIHPDRFFDEEKKTIAQELYKQVATNSSNYKELQRIAVEIEKLLN